MTVLSVILASVFFLVTAAKLVNKLQFRNMKVSAFVFRKEAKKKKKLSCAALRWIVCGLLQSHQEDSTTTWQHTGTLHRLRAPILSRGSTC